MVLPLITLITPSFNQAAYLAETIDSIVSQNYPNLRYFIMDGGSTDGSVEVIQRHERYLAGWVSEPDHGQADALNKGFARALPDKSSDPVEGHLCAYLNSDDLYAAGALHRAAEEYHAIHGSAEAGEGGLQDDTWIVSNVVNFGEGQPDELFTYPVEHTAADRWFWFYANPVHQPGSFWSASLYRRFGPFDTSLRYVFDYDLFMKFRILGNVKPVYVNETLARFRLHSASKTVSQRPKFDAEFEAVRAKIAAQLSPGDAAAMQKYVSRTRADRLQADAVQHLRQGHRGPALRELAQSLWHDPRLLVQRRTLGAIKRLLVS